MLVVSSKIKHNLNSYQPKPNAINVKRTCCRQMDLISKQRSPIYAAPQTRMQTTISVLSIEPRIIIVTILTESYLMIRRKTKHKSISVRPKICLLSSQTVKKKKRKFLWAFQAAPALNLKFLHLQLRSRRLLLPTKKRSSNIF
jgi:hypothetical protein